MSITAIAGILTSLATIVGGFVYFTKFASSKLTKTQAQKEADTAQKEQDEAALLKKAGRPKWD